MVSKKYRLYLHECSHRREISVFDGRWCENCQDYVYIKPIGFVTVTFNEEEETLDAEVETLLSHLRHGE